jgi:hypothetical protein
VQSKEIHQGVGEGFFYVIFDIIKEQVGEVKEFDARAGRMRSRQFSHFSLRISHCAFIIAHWR